MQRRQFLVLSSACCALSSFSAQTFAKTLRTVTVPFPPGGGGDVLARSVTDDWARELGETFIIDNRPGAGGSVGTRRVTRMKPDGLNIAYVTNGVMCVNEKLYDTLNFTASDDLTPIGMLSRIPLVMVLNPKAIPGVTDFKTLLDYAKKNPGVLNVANSGVGTTSHMAAAFLEMKTGLHFTHVPYKGGAEAMLDVLAGRIPFMIDVAPNALPHVEAGKLKALAVTTPERLKAHPDIPTMIELGVKDYSLFAWDGFMLPKGASKDVVARLNEGLNKALTSEAVQKRLASRGAVASPCSPEAFAQFIQSEKPKWAALVAEMKRQGAGKA